MLFGLFAISAICRMLRLYRAQPNTQPFDTCTFGCLLFIEVSLRFRFLCEPLHGCRSLSRHSLCLGALMRRLVRQAASTSRKSMTLDILHPPHITSGRQSNSHSAYTRSSQIWCARQFTNQDFWLGTYGLEFHPFVSALSYAGGHFPCRRSRILLHCDCVRASNVVDAMSTALAVE